MALAALLRILGYGSIPAAIALAAIVKHPIAIIAVILANVFFAAACLGLAEIIHVLFKIEENTRRPAAASSKVTTPKKKDREATSLGQCASCGAPQEAGFEECWNCGQPYKQPS